MNVNINIVLPGGVIPTAKPCNGQAMVGTGGPPIDDQVCVPKPPAEGNWHMSATNGVVSGTWVLD